MIRLLLALHPRSWRVRYEPEFRALLEAAPLTLVVVVDVLHNAARQHARVHGVALRLAAAVVVSVAVEVAAVGSGITDNILWAPSTVLHAAALAALLLPWLPVVRDLKAVARRRLSNLEAR